MYAYAHTPLDEETIKLTGFSSGDKLYAFIRGFYGLKGLPNFFTKQMSTFFRSLIDKRSALVYIDDIVIILSCAVLIYDHRVIRSMFFMLKGCIGVLSSFKLDGLKGLSCISHSRFSGSDAFSPPSSLLVYFEVPALGVFCSRYCLFGTDCALLLFFISFSIFSNFSSIPLLKLATSLFVLFDILWVQIFILCSTV